MDSPSLPPLGTPARLAVGIVSAGRVGVALGVALERVGHVVGAATARSEASRDRLARHLPGARIASPAEVARSSELIVLAVPDSALSDVIRELVDSRAVHSGHIVVHTAGAFGADVMRPIHKLGAVVAAIHPAMTFAGTPDDAEHFDSCGWGVTAPDEIGQAVGESLVLETGGRPVRIEEAQRPLYHAALAHGSNHLVTLIADALLALEAVIGLPSVEGAPGQDAHGAGSELYSPRGHSDRPLESQEESLDPDALASRLLGPLVRVSLENALASGGAFLTGPVMRGDVGTVRRHLDVIGDADAGIAESYRAMALRTARKRRSGPEMISAIENNGPGEQNEH